ncbi:hypothetical protein GCM10023166_02040 [Paeniglutamicibacter cryotolerans]
MSNTKRTSPALTATQMTPARVTSSFRGCVGCLDGIFGLEGVGFFAECGPGVGSLDGLGHGSEATFFTTLRQGTPSMRD